MGLYAEVLAIGPFSRTVITYLEYSSAHYSETRDGVPVVRHLFGITEGSSVGREFAELLGLSNVWDFNEHKLDPIAFDRPGLNEFAATYPDYQADLEALLGLAEAGFDFYFLPNG